MYVYYNPNPDKIDTTDCVIRAICKINGKSWKNVYLELCAYGLSMYAWGDTNRVWNAYLIDNGFSRYLVPESCPNCYTVRDFVSDNPDGKFILATGSHVVAVVNGNYFDTRDSGDEFPVYYFVKKEHD